MERKIGEIFEYNGEWYQCIVENGCENCAFNERNCYTIVDECCADRRKDNKNVIFKKLEKVGEPITVNGKNVQLLKTTIANCDNCAFYKDVNCNFTCYPRKCHGGEEGTYVEIKQTKEDMEEKKQCGDNRFRVIAKAKEHLFQATNIAEDKKELEVLDSFLLRCWQMGWLKQYEEEVEKEDLKTFSLEAAKAGKPVCTKSGKKVRIVCFDKVGAYPVIALVQEESIETCHFYSQDGKSADCGDGYDLIMLCEKRKGYINVYSSIIHDTLENADNVRKRINKSDYLYTLEVEWEE